MARLLTAVDVCPIMNALAKQALGTTDIATVDLSNFASTGERVLATGTENVLNALSIVLGKTIVAVRPYKAKLSIIQAISTGEFTHRMRKISFYSTDSINAGFVNTDLYTNIKDGFDNGSNGGASVASMWKQKIAPVLELNFAGQNVWQEEITLLEKQISTAFRSAEELAAFLNGIITQAMNDVEVRKEAYRRATLINHIAGVVAQSAIMPGSAINLTKKFNDEFGTSYTSEELRTTYQADFLKFFVGEFKIASDLMTEYSTMYHYSPAKQVEGVDYVINRQTPKAKQKSILYGPLFTKAKANVLPEIFNDGYLSVEANEFVNFWQSFKTPATINVKPSVVEGQVSENTTIPFVIGCLFDSDALLVDHQFEGSATSPLEAKKKYRNMFIDISENSISDYTENCIVFYMADED